MKKIFPKRLLKLFLSGCNLIGYFAFIFFQKERFLSFVLHNSLFERFHLSVKSSSYY